MTIPVHNSSILERLLCRLSLTHMSMSCLLRLSPVELVLYTFTAILTWYTSIIKDLQRKSKYTIHEYQCPSVNTWIIYIYIYIYISPAPHYNRHTIWHLTHLHDLNECLLESSAHGIMNVYFDHIKVNVLLLL